MRFGAAGEGDVAAALGWTAALGGGGGGALGDAQRSGAVVLAIRVGGAALAFATQVLLARLLGAAEYGVFAAVWVWLTVAGHLSVWGAGQAACRFLPAYRAQGQEALARGFLSAGTGFALASGAASAGLGALWLFGSDLGEEYRAAVAVGLLLLPLLALQDFTEGVARSFDWPALALAPVYLVRPALIGAALLVVLGTFGAPAEASVALAGALAAAGLALALQAAFLVPRLRRALPSGPRAYRPRAWARSTLPIALVDLATVGLGSVDVVLLSLYAPPEAVAAYFAATRLLQFVVFVPYAGSAATAQRFAAARAQGDEATLRALVARTARLTAAAALGVGGVLLAAAPVLLAAFGPGFGAGLGILAVLVAGIVVQSAFGPAEDLLSMLGGERLCAGVSLGVLGLAVALNLVLIPAWGPMGAAVATALAAATRGFLLSLAAWARLGLRTDVFTGGESRQPGSGGLS